MSLKKETFRKGIVIKGDTDALEGIEGEIKFDSSDKKFKTTANSVAREFVDNSTSQTLSNKSINVDNNTITNIETDNLKSGVFNTSSTLASASDTQIPSALASKTYADSVASTSATNLNNHITDSSDAHDASAISVSAISGLTATDVQAAISEHQTEIVNAQADATQALSDAATAQSTANNHISDATDAHDASAISSIPSGNLAATDVQGALNELQTDIDTRATSSALTAHTGASTGVHGVVGAVVGTTDSQTLINKTITSPIITGADFRTPSRSDVKQDTLANLTTYASSAANGQLCFATDTKQMFQVLDSALVSVGGSSGGADTFVFLDASEQLSGWATGDNSTFLGGGTLAGTFVKETSAPLNGNASYKYTQAASSLDDYIASPVQSVKARFRGNIASIVFPYIYDGGASDIAVVVWDVTNSAKLTDDTINLAVNTPTTGAIYKANVLIPSTCTQIRVGFHVKAVNSGKVLSFDDVQVSADTTLYSNNVETQGYSYSVSAALSPSSNLALGTLVGNSIFSASTTGINILRDCVITACVSASGDSAGLVTTVSIALNGSTTSSANSRRTTAIVLTASTTASLKLIAGDKLTFSSTSDSSISNTRLSVSAVATNANIVQQSDTVSSDSITFNYANAATYTLATLANAPIGTYITYTYAINTNTFTQTTGANRPTQTDSNMNTNGVQLFSRAYNAASTSASPARFEIQIGKGYKGFNLAPYKSSGKVTVASIDLANFAGTGEYGARFKNYDEITGILTLDAGYRATAVTASGFDASDNTNIASVYVVINASKNPALVGIGSNVYAARAVDTSGTSVANSGDTKVALDTSSSIATNMSVDGTNDRIYATVNGIYSVSGAIQFTSQLYAAGNAAEIRLYKNGTYYSTLGRMVMEVASSQIVAVNGSDLISLAVGDYIELFANNNRTAGATTLVTTAGANRFTVNKLGGI